WNSRAIRWACPTNLPTRRISSGRSFGPTTISASAPSRTSSWMPICGIMAPAPSTQPGSDFRLLARGRVDGLALIRDRRGLFLVVVLQPGFEAFNAARHVAHHRADLPAAAEQQHEDHDDE